MSKWTKPQRLSRVATNRKTKALGGVGWGVGCLVLLAVGILGAGTAGAQEQGAVEGKDLNRPVIDFDTKSKDLGRVEEGTKLEFYYEITNKGNEPLKISKVKGSCGCTNVRVEKDELAPGEITKLLGVFNSKGRPGLQTKTITVTSNDPRQSNATLTFKTYVSQEISVKPRSIGFYRVSNEALTTRTLQIDSTADIPLEIKDIKVTGTDIVEARVQSQGPLPLDRDAKTSGTKEGTRTVIELSIQPGVPIGRQRGKLEITTNHPKKPLLEVPISADVTGDLSVSPRLLFYNRAKPGEPATRGLVVSSSSGTPFNITGVEAGDVPVTWKYGESDKPEVQRITFTLTLPEDQQQGGYNAQITLKTDHPRQPLIELPVRASVRRPKPDKAAKPAEDEAAPDKPQVSEVVPTNP